MSALLELLLLRSTDVPLSTVARRCGYSSEFAFAKTFKREFGVAPGAFRRRPEPGPGGPAPDGTVAARG